MGIIEIPYAPIRREGHMTFEDLLDILAEQFSCDAAELSKDTSWMQKTWWSWPGSLGKLPVPRLKRTA